MKIDKYSKVSGELLEIISEQVYDNKLYTKDRIGNGQHTNLAKLSSNVFVAIMNYLDKIFE